MALENEEGLDTGEESLQVKSHVLQYQDNLIENHLCLLLSFISFYLLFATLISVQIASLSFISITTTTCSGRQMV